MPTKIRSKIGLIASRFIGNCRRFSIGEINKSDSLPCFEKGKYLFLFLIF
jgi:hypothetical protein